ncbi:hypothetical protein ACTI_39000 [Actinoplanes sp. OR16]|uniref:hypothetical protein n=1 Tax=Actinoplanes sp. OR16 TaxID=946334 RepID=UPI000F71CA54|nr:hypothetical protein [Actinoplanes sp. OR16]BBH67215.1 hypothetical protein ACTI_39000 [Actinoplanes sp. OR16]
MPIARRQIPTPRRRRAAETAAAAVVAALVVPAAPAAAATTDCRDGQVTARSQADFSARSQADLAKITILDPGPLHRDLPALADVRLASSRGEADSKGKPHKTVATARYADAKLLGISGGQASAVSTAPRSSGPAGVDLAAVDVAGLATVKSGTARAEATWDDAYRCGKTGPLTRSATMLAGLDVLGGTHGVPVLSLASHRSSLLRVGPTGSTQSATDLVRLKGGRVGVRAGAGVALGDLSLFTGTEHEIGIKVVTQPTLEVVAAPDSRHSAVDYRPAVLEVTSGGETVSTLRDAGADVSISVADSLGLIGGKGSQGRHDATVRLSLGQVTSDVSKRKVSASAATLRVEVKIGTAHLLDVALGYMSVAACAPAAVKPPRGDHGGYSPSPSPSAAAPSRHSSPAPSPSPSASASASASPSAAVRPVALGEPLPGDGGTGGALALTGSNVAVIGLGGAALVLFGAVALLLGRRRRG